MEKKRSLPVILDGEGKKNIGKEERVSRKSKKSNEAKTKFVILLS